MNETVNGVYMYEYKLHEAPKMGNWSIHASYGPEINGNPEVNYFGNIINIEGNDRIGDKGWELFTVCFLTVKREGRHSQLLFDCEKRRELFAFFF